MSQTIQGSFDIDGRDIEAEAHFSGTGFTLTIWEKGNIIDHSSNSGDLYPYKRGLNGAALAAYDKAWLKDMVIMALRSTDED